jgi:hypothetical protein
MNREASGQAGRRNDEVPYDSTCFRNSLTSSGGIGTRRIEFFGSPFGLRTSWARRIGREPVWRPETIGKWQRQRPRRDQGDAEPTT